MGASGQGTTNTERYYRRPVNADAHSDCLTFPYGERFRLGLSWMLG